MKLRSKDFIQVLFCNFDLDTINVCANDWLVDFNPTKIVSEYDQEIPQSQTADKPMAPRGRAAQPSRDTRKTSKAKQPALSSPSR